MQIDAGSPSAPPVAPGGARNRHGDSRLTFRTDNCDNVTPAHFDNKTVNLHKIWT